jgi:WD40 repeat protein
MAPSKIDSMRVRTAEFSPDGNFLVNTFAGGKIRIWSTKTWENPEDIYLNKSPVTAYRFTLDGKNLLVGFASGEIFILNLESRKVTTATKAAGGVTGIEISGDGRQFITSHISDNTQYPKGPFVMVWKKIDPSGSSGTPILNSGKASLSPDGKLLAFCGDTLKIHSMADMKMVMAWKLPEMSILETKTVPERYTQSPDYEKQKEKVEKKLPSRIVELTFSPDCKTLAVGTMLGTILVFNLDTAMKNELHNRLIKWQLTLEYGILDYFDRRLQLFEIG